MDEAITADPTSALIVAEQQLAELAEQLRDALREEQEAAAARVQYLGSMLQAKIDERTALRSEIEQRWLRAIRQINGIYERRELPKKTDPEEYGSELYVPLTRRLRNMVDARLGDMLFPNDDRGWVLKPSPKAELAEVTSMLKEMSPDAPVKATGMPPGATVKDLQQSVEGVQKEAEIRAHRMQRTVDDRLAEAQWPAKGRRALSDAIDFGTGVVKGPVPALRRKRLWIPVGGGVELRQEDYIAPEIEYVSVWNFYPDMSATSMDDCIDVFEAHPMSRLELAALREQPGFNAASIDIVLGSDPLPDNKTRRQDLRDIAGLSGAKDDRYIVWEYHGPLKGSDLNACMRLEHNDYDEDGNANPYKPPFDEDEDYSGVVWFCESQVLKAIVRPLTTEHRHIYSVIWWQRDKSSIFGFGLADEVRDQQISANSAYRAMHDNAGLTLGPQVVFDDEVIEPVDGKWEMRPFKMWRKKNPSVPVSAAFGFYQVDSRIAELGTIFDRSKVMMDEVATVPAFVSGAEQPNYMQSATGASLAYNASTLWVRRFVRHWDDDMIQPLMTRMVEWEMDHNPDQSIKGDYKPIARGVTALVELEGSGQRMLQFVQLAQQMGVPPKDQMRILRKLALSLKLDPDDVLPTEEEVEQMQSSPNVDPEAERIKMQDANNQRVHEAKMAMLSMKGAELEARADEMARREKLALLEIAARERMSVEAAARKYNYDLAKLDAEMANNEAQRRHEAQLQNAETAVKLRMGSGL